MPLRSNCRLPGQLKIFLILSLFLLAVLIFQYYPPLQEEVTRNTSQKVSRQDMVDLDKFIPGIKIELRYASDKNFTKSIIYDNNIAYLRRGTAEKLKAAQEEFATHGYTIKIWDAYRPPRAQFRLWEKCPDARFVINPHKGYSYHSRGIAVDITLVDENGQELLMPTGFDDFTARADRDYNDIDPKTADNARLLEEVMIKNGFESIYYEWWHFIDRDRDKYQVIDLEEQSLE